MNRCVFLDRDGVLNYDSPGYVFEVDKYRIFHEIIPQLEALKIAGFLLIVITNQAGISRGIYTRKQMEECHHRLQEESGHIISDIYYSPYHPTVTKSLSRKPGTLLFERAIAKWDINVTGSWMIGDKQSDLEPGRKIGLKTIGVKRNHPLSSYDHMVTNLAEISGIILK